MYVTVPTYDMIIILSYILFATLYTTYKLHECVNSSYHDIHFNLQNLL